MFGAYVIKQYERAVLFKLGKVKGEAREPGLLFCVPLVNRIHRVSLRIITMPIQSQGIITKDNVSIDVSAVAYFRVKDLIRSVIAIENVQAAINQIAQTTCAPWSGVTRWMRRCRRPTRSTRTSSRSLTSRPRSGGSRSRSSSCGIFSCPRACSARWPARPRPSGEGAKIIAAQGEALAAGELAVASDVMMAHPLALQLRNLQTLVEVAVDEELDGRVPGAVDEHDRGARRISRPAKAKPPRSSQPRPPCRTHLPTAS